MHARLQEDPADCDLMRPAFLRAEARIDLGRYTAVEGMLLAHPLHAAARHTRPYVYPLLRSDFDVPGFFSKIPIVWQDA